MDVTAINLNKICILEVFMKKRFAVMTAAIVVACSVLTGNGYNAGISQDVNNQNNAIV